MLVFKICASLIAEICLVIPSVISLGEGPLRVAALKKYLDSVGQT